MKVERNNTNFDIDIHAEKKRKRKHCCNGTMMLGLKEMYAKLPSRRSENAS